MSADRVTQVKVLNTLNLLDVLQAGNAHREAMSTCSKKRRENGTLKNLQLDLLPGERLDHGSKRVSKGDERLHFVTQGEHLRIVPENTPRFGNIILVT
ncbi:hypothetical protein HG531_001786 [Fusarium graminearum]|nr:hypothetical protein HG531_001786 [Fusarium graminearum]